MSTETAVTCCFIDNLQKGMASICAEQSESDASIGLALLWL